MTAFARRSPASLALWLAPLASATVFSSVAFAQSSSSRAQPYADPYRSGSTRPLDGSPRSGVYSTKPAPSYETTRRGVGAPVGPRELPAIWSGLYVGVQGGYRWSNTEVTGVPAISTKGFQGGGHIGYNFQTSSNLVLGLETDLMLGGATSSSTNGATTATMRDTWCAMSAQSTFRCTRVCSMSRPSTPAAPALALTALHAPRKFRASSTLSKIGRAHV